MINKTQHSELQLMIEQHEPHQNPEVNSERLAVPALVEKHVMLMLNETNII